jgi:hypothetical protein
MKENLEDLGQTGSVVRRDLIPALKRKALPSHHKLRLLDTCVDLRLQVTRILGNSLIILITVVMRT